MWATALSCWNGIVRHSISHIRTSDHKCCQNMCTTDELSEPFTGRDSVSLTFTCLTEYRVRLLSFRTGIIKSICVKEMTLLFFSFRHTSLPTVHTDLHGHTASGCLCRSRPLQWCLCTCHGFLDVRNRVKETPLQVGFHFWEQQLSSRC